MILKGYPRISETFISNEILLLESLGFKLHLFSMRHPREDFTHRSVAEIRAAVTYLPETLWKPLPVLVYHNTRRLLKAPVVYANALKLALRRFARTRKSATVKHLLQAGYLVERCLPGTGVVHLHAHFAHSPTSVALFASRLSGLPFSFTAHAKDIYTSHPDQLREKIESARFVVTCTEYNRHHLESLILPPETESNRFSTADLPHQNESDGTPVHRIYHGIDLKLFAGGRSRTEIAEPVTGPYRLLTVARLTAKKGLPTMYRALRRLFDQGIRFNHTLIGDGEQRDQILGLIRELNLQDVVHWAGTQPHHVVIDHYRSSHLFVLSCEVAPNGDRDGIPNVLLESMAMGVPVVTTRVSAIPELVEDGRHGLLVSPGRPSELAAAMVRMLTDTGLRERVISNARRRVELGFDNRGLARELADVYRSAVPEFAPASDGSAESRHEDLFLRSV